MWTHRSPYRSSSLTVESIQYHGELGLFRALNIGRLVAFVGSGLSIPYGRKNWKELVDDACNYTNTQLSQIQTYPNISLVKGQPLHDLKCTLDILTNDSTASSCDDETDLLKIRMEVCENIARRMDIECPPPGADETWVGKFRKTLMSSISLKETDPVNDPIDLIYNQLRVKRFLAVNYDVALEAYLVDKRGFATVGAGPQLEALVKAEKGLDSPLTSHPVHPKYRVEDSMGRSAISVTLRDNSIGTLVGFASLASAHRAQIFHLHGRRDDTENLIVTERDYQRLYLERTPSRQTFLEGLDALFLGNDVLFAGVGMNESDLLRPLRQFVAEERSPDSEARHVFVLLPNPGPREATRKALQLKTCYGVETLFFGDKLHHQMDILSVLQEYKASNAAESRERLWSTYGQLEEKPRSEEPADISPVIGLCQHFSLLNGESQLLVERALGAVEKGEPLPEGIDHGKLKTELTTASLCEYLRQLTVRQRRWWQDWREMPNERETRFTLIAKGDCPVWVRQKPVYPAVTEQPRSKVLKDARIAVEAQYPAREFNGRRIVRFASERGSGKGAFFEELKRQYNGIYNFAYLMEGEGRHSYRGALFAHTSSSPEFGSVVGALVKFIAGRCAPEKASKYFEENPGELLNSKKERLWEKSRSPHRLKQLEYLLQYYSSAANAKGLEPGAQRPGRLFIALSGLDSLCDAEGIAYNPYHREFFRVLTDPRFKDAPIDLVFLSGTPARPIRHLSEEEYVAGTERQEQLGHTRLQEYLVAEREPPARAPNAIPSARVDLESKKGHFLQHTVLHRRERFWTPLTPLPLEDRYWLKEGNARFLGLDGLEKTPILKGLLEESVALDNWVSRCAKRCESAISNGVIGGMPKWLQELEQAATRGGMNEVIGVVFRTYFVLDELHLEGLPRHWRRDTHGALLQHISLFSIPIQRNVLACCPVIKSRFPKKSLDALERELKVLAERGFIFEAAAPQWELTGDPAEEIGEQARYTLHSKMREYLATQMDFSLPDRGERSFFEVSMYSMLPRELPTPAERHFRLVHGVVQALIDECRDTLSAFYPLRADDEQGRTGEEQDAKVDLERRRVELEKLDKAGLCDRERLHGVPQKLRAAYSIVRSHFSIGSISRLERFQSDESDPERPYELYRSWLRGLLNAAIGLDYVGGPSNGADRWYPFREAVENKSQFKLRGAFYREEILWLYNERALTAYVQGKIYDALPTFEQALRFVTRRNKDAFAAGKRRLNLNLALAHIDRGNLRKAGNMLGELASRAGPSAAQTPNMTEMLARGFLGLCDHLGGRLASARERYEYILAQVSSSGQLRTIGIFNCFFADLLRLEGHYEQARKLLQHAVLAARQGEQRDVFHFALVSEARLARDQEDKGEFRKAQTWLDQAETYADEMGIPKIKADVLKIRAEIMLTQGETDFAGRLAARSVGICSQHGMRLRKLSALVVYGKIVAARGQVDLATEILKDASQEASHLGYHLKADQASRFVREVL
jgi:tetratricopeptide (TPR) repeat protein